MGASQQPFYALHEDLAWFIQCPELRVLHVATGGEERPIALQQVALSEGHPRNRSPFFVLEDAHTKADEGWAMRAERMRGIHGARREAMARQGHKLPFLPPAETAGFALGTLVEQVRQCLDAQRAVPELTGLVLVLAPTQLEDAKTFAQSVRRMADANGLSGVRFVVVEIGDAARGPLAGYFGDALIAARCFVDRDARERETRGLLEAAAAAPVGASPEVQAGCAGPRDVRAPARHGKPERDAELPIEVVAALQSTLGPAAALIGPPGHLLRRRVLGAASAVQNGRLAEALRLQAEARDQCYAANLERLGVLLEVSRVSYVAMTPNRKVARKGYESIAQRATASGYFDLAAQALLGAASLSAIDKDWHAAALLANRAGMAGERSGEPVLAIEAYRCAGQFALKGGSEKAAIDRWKHALEIATSAPPDAASLSSAPAVARALAKVFSDLGAETPAAQLLDQADEIERGALPERRKQRRRKKKVPKMTPTGTAVMAHPLRPGAPTDSEIEDRIKAQPKSVTPTGTEIVSELPVKVDDVRR